MQWSEIRRGLAGAAAGAAVLLAALPAAVLAAPPDPSAEGVGDPRSSGQGPGLVGDPLLAILVVAAIATATLLATLAYVRLTGGPARDGRAR